MHRVARQSEDEQVMTRAYDHVPIDGPEQLYNIVLLAGKQSVEDNGRQPLPSHVSLP